MPAAASGDLEPDLDAVVDRAVGSGRAALVAVASGMAVAAIDGLRRARAQGGAVVVLDPASCSQPGMPTAVLGSGVADHVVSFAELAWLIAHADNQSVRLAAAI